MSAFDRMRDIVERWTPHREKLLKAIEYCGGTHDEDDVLHMLFVGKAKLMTSEKTAVVLRTLEYPKFRAMEVFLLAGELMDVIVQEPKLEAEAKAMGCKRIEWRGRDSWRAATKDRPDGLTGYKAQSTVFYKDL